jgi:hypothetical protein
MPIARIVAASLTLAGLLLVLAAGALANPVAHASAASVAMPAVDRAGAVALALLGVAFAAAAFLTRRLAGR